MPQATAEFRPGFVSARVVAQLEEELDRTLTGPVAALLGIDLAQQLAERIRVWAPMLAAELAGDDDQAVQTARDIIGCLWHAAPEQVGHADWWRTPLGRLCARSLARDDH